MFPPSAATVPLTLKTSFMVLMPSMNPFHVRVSVPPFMGRAAADRCVSFCKKLPGSQALAAIGLASFGHDEEFHSVSDPESPAPDILIPMGSLGSRVECE
jgi:hypothetical protein